MPKASNLFGGRIWSRRAATAVVATCVVAGVWLRCTNIGLKYFWLDEVHAALLRSGHAEADIFKLYDGRPRPLLDLQDLVRVESQRPIFDTARTLAKYHPVHPPTYYVLLRIWTEFVGDSPAATRGLSIVFSLFCFPAVYWLARELFRSRAAAWTAVALWSVSPPAVLYAQEAKQYSLFAATTMLAAAAFLRAMRIRTAAGWCWFSVASATATWVHLLFLPVLAAMGSYVFLLHLRRLNHRRTWRVFGAFALSAGFAVASFLPWIAYSLSLGDAGVEIIKTHMSIPQPAGYLLAAWISNIGCIFSDLGFSRNGWVTAFYAGLWLLVIGLTVYAFQYLLRRGTPRTWLFAGLLAVVPAGVLMAPDVIFGGARSMLTRYWTATAIAVILILAGALSRQFAAPNPRRRGFAVLATLGLLGLGLFSSVRSSQADYWWNKMGVPKNHRTGREEYDNMIRSLRVISQTKRPLIVTERGFFQECRIVSFTYYVNNPDIEWVGSLDPEKLQLPDDRPIFFFEAGDLMGRLLKQGWTFYKLEPSGAFAFAKPPSKAAPALSKFVGNAMSTETSAFAPEPARSESQ